VLKMEGQVAFSGGSSASLVRGEMKLVKMKRCGKRLKI
jgi:hypothetical protein